MPSSRENSNVTDSSHNESPTVTPPIEGANLSRKDSLQLDEDALQLEHDDIDVETLILSPRSKLKQKLKRKSRKVEAWN